MPANHNPYSPPTTPLAEQAAPQNTSPPHTVFVALVLIVLGRFIEAIARIRYIAGLQEHAFKAIEIAWLLVILAVAIWLSVFISRGRNWARYALLALTVLEVLAVASALWMNLPAGVRFAPDIGLLTFYALPPVLDVAAICLLFGPARAWYKPPHTAGAIVR